MANALVIRSTSTTAAALLVGAVFAAALGMRFHYQGQDVTEPPPIWTYERPIEKDPPPPPPTTVHRRDMSEPLFVVEPVLPVETGPALPTTLPTPEPAFASGPVEIVDPHWTERPGGLSRYYPDRALSRGVEGVVSLDCVVQVTGALDCAIAQETPQNWGFGQAALRISRDYRMVPATRDGLPVEGRYHMRVPFDIN